jgi:5-methylcytosine-specific restriction endonuclease McrA
VTDEIKAIRKSMSYLRDEIAAHTWTRCVNCGSAEHIEYHHIVPLANGGNHIFTNIVPLCYECHLKAHNKIMRNPYHKSGTWRKKTDGKLKRKAGATA